MSTGPRPTKTQSELLSYIGGFIKGHGYGPSYREIMRALDYKSVSTVAVHVDNLIKIGRLKKADHSARSLVVIGEQEAQLAARAATPEQTQWLVEAVGRHFEACEAEPTREGYEQLLVLVEALSVLGLKDAAADYRPRLEHIKTSLGYESESVDG